MTKLDQYDYNGFKYYMEYLDETSIPTITHSKQIPEYLYKFYPISKFSVDSALNSYFYASHPIELNDCLDSSPFLLYTSKPLEFDLYEKFLSDAYKNKQDLIDYWENDIDNQCKGYIEQMYNVSFNLLGLISMTSKENNPLMWPHYTQEKGFQLKFKTENLENGIINKLKDGVEQYLGLYPINYSKELNPIDISQFQTWHIPLWYATNVKSEKWAYEEEWRFIISKHNMGVPFSKSGLHIQPDYYKDIRNRYTNYPLDLVEELCVGMDFFTRVDFEINWKSKTEFVVKPKKDNDNYENYIRLLDYISEKLNDKLYHSGIKYELNSDSVHYLIRTKEKLVINSPKSGEYHLTRTSHIIKLID